MLRDATIPPALVRGYYDHAEGVVYGAGIVTDANLGIGHNGTVIGYHADAWHENGVTAAVLCNTNAPLHDDGRDPTREIAQGILAILK